MLQLLACSVVRSSNDSVSQYVTKSSHRLPHLPFASACELSILEAMQFGFPVGGQREVDTRRPAGSKQCTCHGDTEFTVSHRLQSCKTSEEEEEFYTLPS